jgi:RNA polymerase sigma-70 factor, ECF subfamily
MLAGTVMAGDETGAAADRAAVARIAARDPRGLEALYDRYATSIHSLALRILRDAAEAEDVTQEVFAQAWAQASRFDAARGAVGAWLMVIARSRALDRVRRRRPGQVGDGDARIGAIPDPAPSVEMVAASAQEVASARRALAALPLEQRAAVELAYYDGLTQVEIAAQTGTPLGTVKTRIRTGLQRIREAMHVGPLTPGSEA